jgi:predicted nucleotidyltransferase
MKHDMLLNKIKSIVQEQTDEATVILYGSRARGDNRADSDWDIMILLNQDKIEPEEYDRISYPIYDLGLELDEQISVNLYTSKDWQKRNFTVFYKNIEKEGIIL